jgi:hypothetical protein
MMPTIFDDLRIRDRAYMPDGYLGTYSGFPANLARLADALDHFDEWWKKHKPHASDVEILSSDLWRPVVTEARAIIGKSEAWRTMNCSTNG